MPLFNLADQKKSDISKKIIQDSSGGRLYFLILFLSVGISTFGLLTNSTAVVIGAMLVAPILRPIQGLAFAISTGNKNLFFRAFKFLLLSFSLSVGGSYFLTQLVPFAEITSEISIRTNPTLIDIFIAVFAGMVGIISLGYPRMIDAVAGVAIAASLVPPLSIIGIGLFFQNLGIVWGSFLLFSANLVSIILIGVVVFTLFGFWPNNDKNKIHAGANIFFVVIVSILVAFPLFGSMIKINENYQFKKEVNGIIDKNISELDGDIYVKNIEIIEENDFRKVFLELSLPSDLSFDLEAKTEILKDLNKKSDKEVVLEIRYLEKVVL